MSQMIAMRPQSISGPRRREEVGGNRLAADGRKLRERRPEGIWHATDAPRMKPLVAQVEVRFDDDGRNLINQRAMRMFVSHAADSINAALRGQPIKC